MASRDVPARTPALTAGAPPVVLVVMAVLLSVAGCGAQPDVASGPAVPETAVIVREAVPQGAAVATFAGGCFWCLEAAMQETPGVSHAISGYAGGTEIDPTYRDVYTGSTGHRESVQVYYDPAVVTYPELLDVFWRSIDPTDAGGQFVDRGMPYTTAIFARDDDQRATAERSRADLDASGRFDGPIVTPVLPFTTFYEAEEYHQDFYRKSAERYGQYEEGSGREEFKEQVWRAIEESS